MQGAEVLRDRDGGGLPADAVARGAHQQLTAVRSACPPMGDGAGRQGVERDVLVPERARAQHPIPYQYLEVVAGEWLAVDRYHALASGITEDVGGVAQGSEQGLRIVLQAREDIGLGAAMQGVVTEPPGRPDQESEAQGQAEMQPAFERLHLPCTHGAQDREGKR